MPCVSGAAWLQIATNALHANGPFSMAIWSWTAPLKPNNQRSRPQLGMPLVGKARRYHIILFSLLLTSTPIKHYAQLLLVIENEYQTCIEFYCIFHRKLRCY